LPYLPELKIVTDQVQDQAQEEAAPTRKNRPRLSPHNAWWRDFVEILLLILTIYTLVNLATARAVVEGRSMEPNFYTGQLVIVNRFVYYFNKPVRGDVIVLHNPQNPTQDDFIKRIVGLPGETVQIKEGRVYVNGILLDEPYIERFCMAGCDGTWSLDSEHYFVLGDNRSNSHDSHAFGPLARDLTPGCRCYPAPRLRPDPEGLYACANQHADAVPNPRSPDSDGAP
jgi:signal peptidase I